MNFQAVLFDCDGVLVDSEPITNGVLHTMFNELGWAISKEQCIALFVGHAVVDRKELIEASTGKPMTEAWLASFRDRRDAALRAQLLAVPYIHATVKALHEATQGMIACASGADRGKVRLQLGKVELLHYFDTQIYSGYEVPRNKPHPDIYLKAAAGLGADITRCAVVEDSSTGATAGVASGATVFGYAPDGDGAVLRAVGVQHVFQTMADLPRLMGIR